MTATLDRIFEQMALFSKEVAGLQTNFLDIVCHDIQRYFDITEKQKDQMYWKGMVTFSLTLLSGTFAIVGALITSGITPNGTQNPSSLNVRMQAAANFNDAIAKQLKWLAQKLNDNDFLKETCKTAATTFQGLNGVNESWQGAKITEFEAKRSMLQAHVLASAQQTKTQLTSSLEKIDSAALSIISAKAKAGG
jgi:hypothetical protein